MKCPQCGYQDVFPRNPIPTVDAIIEIDDGIVLIKRKNEPYGWALPGGFVDYGVTDTSKEPDKKLESQIWHSIQKVIEKKYKIHPNSWEKKRID